MYRLSDLQRAEARRDAEIVAGGTPEGAWAKKNKDGVELGASVRNTEAARLFTFAAVVFNLGAWFAWLHPITYFLGVPPGSTWTSRGGPVTTGEAIFVFFFVMPHVAGGVFMAWTSWFNWCGRIRVRFSRDRILLVWSAGPLAFRRTIPKSREVSVGLVPGRRTDPNRSNAPGNERATKIEVQSAGRSISFGSILTEAEGRWIVAMIRSRLPRPKAAHRPTGARRSHVARSAVAGGTSMEDPAGRPPAAVPAPLPAAKPVGGTVTDDGTVVSISLTRPNPVARFVPYVWTGCVVLAATALGVAWLAVGGMPPGPVIAPILLFALFPGIGTTLASTARVRMEARIAPRRGELQWGIGPGRQFKRFEPAKVLRVTYEERWPSLPGEPRPIFNQVECVLEMGNDIVRIPMMTLGKSGDAEAMRWFTYAVRHHLGLASGSTGGRP
ncbi:MAG: hypothetical protein H6810_08645 [Phycisphaeraceae bacterium]|nr:MAG: hypothetical protein H6810_08645 [Phycisphaeraceae bacterium]